MIPDFCLTAWRQHVPWIEDYQIEQDLIISRALIHLYQNDTIKNALAFRGGTALNKLYLFPPARYSEDIDLVQIHPEPIGKVINAIRFELDNWLGKPSRKLTERGAKLVYYYQSKGNLNLKLKIEINTTEHFHVFDFVEHPFLMHNPWFSGETLLRTYQLDELMGTKLRALYQRRKGRDLFDLWTVLDNKLVDCETVLKVFQTHNDQNNQIITRALFEKNFSDKIQHQDFQHDIIPLLAHQNNKWSFEKACELVNSQLISALPGESWKKHNDLRIKIHPDSLKIILSQEVINLKSCP